MNNVAKTQRRKKHYSPPTFEAYPIDYQHPIGAIIKDSQGYAEIDKNIETDEANVLNEE